MPDYQNGKIYKLWSPEGDDIYIGSTTTLLSDRKAKHKHSSSNREISSKILFQKYNDVRIELLECFPCNNKEELIKKEGQYIRNNICVNMRVAGRTKKEWCQDNIEKHTEYQREYHKENKDMIIEKSREYMREYYQSNKEAINEQKKGYREKNKDRINQKSRENYEKNKEAINEKRREKRRLKKE